MLLGSCCLGMIHLLMFVVFVGSSVGDFLLVSLLFLLLLGLVVLGSLLTV